MKNILVSFVDGRYTFKLADGAGEDTKEVPEAVLALWQVIADADRAMQKQLRVFAQEVLSARMQALRDKP